MKEAFVNHLTFKILMYSTFVDRDIDFIYIYIYISAGLSDVKFLYIAEMWLSIVPI